MEVSLILHMNSRSKLCVTAMYTKINGVTLLTKWETT